MLWVNEIPWQRFNVNDELTVQCRASWRRKSSVRCGRNFYQWKHLPAGHDRDDYLPCRPKGSFFSRHGPILARKIPQPRNKRRSCLRWRQMRDSRRHAVPHRRLPAWRNVEKIKLPVVTVDAEDTEARFNAMQTVFGGILPVRKVGLKHYWFTPWDNRHPVVRSGRGYD